MTPTKRSAEDEVNTSTKKLRIVNDLEASSSSLIVCTADTLSAIPRSKAFTSDKLSKFRAYLEQQFKGIRIEQEYKKNNSKLVKCYENRNCLILNYQSPTFLYAAFNARGIIINTEYDSNDTITDLRQLRPTCKVVLLTPSLKFWWNDSANVLKSHINELGNDMLSMKQKKSEILMNFLRLHDVPFEELLKAAQFKIESRERDDGRAALFPCEFQIQKINKVLSQSLFTKSTTTEH